ncbi:MAG: hypothetical protein HKN27_01170 [Silicimonas sp.]|nr:hypothetical protein [Silicimonas sp.]
MLGEDQEEWLATLGWKRFTLTEKTVLAEQFQKGFETEEKVSIGALTDGTFAAKQKNLLTYKTKVWLNDLGNGSTQVDQQITFESAPLGYALGYWLNDFGADVATSMQAQLDHKRDWSIIRALFSSARKDAKALRGGVTG